MGKVNPTELAEVIELLSYNHELVFRLDNKQYILQPEGHDLVLYRMEPTFQYLARIPNPPELGHIDVDVIKKILDEKCFEGLSFIERLEDIWIEDIF